PEPLPASEPEAPSAPTAPEPPPAPPPGGAPAASPAARMRAKELGRDLDGIAGSGPGGAIVLADVEAAAQAAAAPAKKTRASPMEEMRKAIAAAMSRSKRTIPHFYLSQTIDLQPASDWLERRNAGSPPTDRLLMGALFVRAAVLAAAQVNALNGHYTEDGFRPAGQVNPGVAIALRGGGLVAPAILDAQPMGVDAIMAGMRDLVTRARAGRLRGREMTEGTITVSALGESGAEAMAGIIFPPQVALVALGAPQKRPWIAGSSVVPRLVGTVTIAADHRVADGRQAARFLAEFESRVLQPEAL
ncbi:MAG: 2-oxo acid dehydrogenase subunit E2, partial [Rhodobacteraceae bacterium]|nr:2-oxo acid dehydrogenase subunit E2 [Paracoccaceae bacterium]